ncbi:MAG: sigma-70 family RNA polymerase sigma factor [Gemmatimonadetes bacterium]|nr:sigma-70 family RNA polymerase sigma factor [Gemmatimonadota bacterium]
MRDSEFEAAYAELRRVASRYLGSLPHGPVTLQTTALVHEAYLKLAASPSVTIRDRDHARALMATAMRQVLVDHLRRRKSAKRGGDRILVPLGESIEDPAPAEDALAVHRAIERLKERDPESAHLIELSCFGGYRQEEIAQILGVTARTVRNRWNRARERLRQLLSDDEDV